MAIPNDMSRITRGLAGLESACNDYTGNPTVAARSLVRRSIVLRKEAADGAAGTLTAYTAADSVAMRCAVRVLGFRITSRSTLTAADATSAVINVVKGDGLGGAHVVCATLTTNVASGDWVAGGVKVGTLTLVAGAANIPAGGVLGFNIAKTSTGTAVPICSIAVDIEEEAPDAYSV